MFSNHQILMKKQEKKEIKKEEIIIDYEYVDTHIHLEYIIQKEKKQYEDLEKRISSKYYGGCITSFCDSQGLSEGFSLYKELLKHEKVWASFAFHPHNAKYYNENTEKRILELIEHEKCIAFGEMGLDFYKNISDKDIQIKVFKRLLELGVKSKKPLVIHSRQAESETLQILKEYCPNDYPIHIHCFTDSSKFAKQLLGEFNNLYFGFTGVLTYKSANDLQNTVKDVIPLNRILFETDGPYMPPDKDCLINGESFKGKNSNPNAIPYIAKKIAELKKEKLSDVLKQVRQNTKDLYKI